MLPTIFLISAFIGLASASRCCPDGFTKSGNECYWLSYPRLATYSEAQRACKLVHPEATLVVPVRSSGFIEAARHGFGRAPTRGMEYLMGIRYLYSHQYQDWGWESARTDLDPEILRQLSHITSFPHDTCVTYSLTAGGRPQSRLASFFDTGTYDYQLTIDFVPCEGERHYFWCSMSAQNVGRKACPCPELWWFSAPSAQCYYKESDEPKTFDEATEHCREIGGELVVERERDRASRDIWEKLLDPAPEFTWYGLYRPGTRGRFAYISEADNDPFADAAASGINSLSGCAAVGLKVEKRVIGRHGMRRGQNSPEFIYRPNLQTFPCSQLRYYICSKPAL